MIRYIDWKDYNSKNGSWLKKHILWVFWNNNNVSELCENCIFCDGNYAYTRVEELSTGSGEVLFTREYKATLSKEKLLTYKDIDEFKIFRNMYSEDEIVLKTKKEYKDLMVKINKKLTKLGDVNNMLENISVKVRKKIDLINKLIISKLEKEIYSDGEWSKLDKLNQIDAKIDAIVDEALSVVCKMIDKKNRKRSKKINIDKKSKVIE